ncbi:MAG: peptidylprolyl isomerase [Blastocatellia bacterium]|jgi:parvulin-like peptidyl-prolyl isomerase
MNRMKTLLPLALVFCALNFLGATVARAQEPDANLVDEVIARVNTGVIMRSSFESSQRDVLEELKKQGLKGDELEKKFTEWKPRILDELINTQLLAQRAKDLSINVDAQVNQQLLRMMKENNCESLECLTQKMREANFDIDEVKRIMSENFSKDAVIGREVYGRVYQQLTEKEKRDAYDKNMEFFTEPSEITLSRIFVAFGKDPARAAETSQEILRQARGGAVDFGALAERYSDDDLGKKNKGLIGVIKVPDLAPNVRQAVEKAAAGTITDPVKLENGYYIFRVDQRKDPVALPYEDEKVQDAIGRYLVNLKSEKQIETYLAKLRDEAFIEIDPRFQFDNSKVKSAMIRRVPYIEQKERKRLDKEKEKEKKSAAKVVRDKDND